MMTYVLGMKSIRLSTSRATLLCLAIGLMLLNQSTASSQEQRTWKDRSGQFSVDATFTSQDDDSVSLRTAAGQVIKVSKTKLSKQDLDYLQTLAAPAPKLTAAAAEQMLTAKLNAAPVAVKPNERMADFVGRLGVPAYVDVSRLNQIGLTPDVPLANDVQAASLGEQLDAILSPHGLTWYRLRTVLVVATTEASEERAMETLAYRIPIPRNDATAVIKRLQAVEPSSWEALGGSGSVVVLPGAVMIRQTGEIHRKLVKQLKIRSLPHRYIHPLDNMIVSMDLTEGKLDEFAKQLGSQLNRKVGLADAGAAAQQARLSVKLPNVSAADALELVSAKVGAQWLENPAGVELVASGIAEQRLEQRRVTIPFASPQLASLVIQAAMTLVEPDSWSSLGGPGNIQHVGGKSFQLSQTQPTIRKLNQLVADVGVPR